MPLVADAPLRILLLEDSPLDAELTLAALEEAGLAFTVIRADTAETFDAGLDAGPDLILSDYRLPTYNGMTALQLARQRRPDVPFIFVSGALGEELAIESLKDGATDYVLKQRIGRLGPAVRRAVREAADRRARNEVERGLRHSEDRYRFLADAVPQIVWTARPDGAIDYCNARWHEYTGLTVEQARDGGWAGAVYPDDVAAMRTAWAAAQAEGVPFDAEQRLRRRDGAFRWHLSRSVPRRDADGRVVQWVGTATDIDDRRRAEAEHRRLLGQLDAIIGTMNEGLTVADGGGRVLSINAAGLRIHGLADASEFLGHVSTLADRFEVTALDGTPVPTDRLPLVRALAGETFTDYRVRVHRASVDRRWVGSYAGAPIRDERGRVEMAVVTFRDVTAQVRADAELAGAKRDADVAREQAEAANRSKDEFLATLSHELRTPLNAILGWVQLLRADADAGATDAAELSQGLATVERNARVQAQLIEDLLDVSRIVSGKVRLAVRRTDLRPVLAAAVDVVRPAAQAKGVRLDLPQASAPAPVVGDPNRLQQVAWNLLANAVKFTPPGGTVRAALDRVGGDMELAVSDSGRGIAADFLPFVFDRFRQADGTASRQHGGLGLGLAIVRHLVELHGGIVTAESDGPGRGATFRVRLPLSDGAADDDDASASARLPAGQPLLAGVRAVVVDDEPDARGLVAAVLRRAGAEVTAVATAAEALAAVTAVRPAVLVSDIAMPGGDGFGLIAAVRRLPPTAGGRTPAVALTAYAGAEDRDRVVRAGFDAHLPKPLDAAALLHTVAALATNGR